MSDLWTASFFVALPRRYNKEVEDQALPCADKQAFNSEKEALDQARVIKWRRDTKLKAYKCRHCGLWHLSSNP